MRRGITPNQSLPYTLSHPNLFPRMLPWDATLDWGWLLFSESYFANCLSTLSTHLIRMADLATDYKRHRIAKYSGVRMEYRQEGSLINSS
ncbi:hypothetical protein NPIL_172601 [Nephila pilipes]|uniref:Uncharacterized protein n=1 Tax=Nephila pilipes TaxID=299642 RepID=A0A8X6TUZ4_NEPPI|nr:hypothetical protein NPIL_172601 [Nephila pilipes]